MGFIILFLVFIFGTIAMIAAGIIAGIDNAKASSYLAEKYDEKHKNKNL